MGLFDTLIITKEEKNSQFPKEEVAKSEKDSNLDSATVNSTHACNTSVSSGLGADTHK